VRGSFGQFFNVYVTNNIIATQKLLETVKGSGIKWLVYASSSSVYGNTPVLPAKEESTMVSYSIYRDRIYKATV